MLSQKNVTFLEVENVENLNVSGPETVRKPVLFPLVLSVGVDRGSKNFVAKVSRDKSSSVIFLEKEVFLDDVEHPVHNSVKFVERAQVVLQVCLNGEVFSPHVPPL